MLIETDRPRDAEPPLLAALAYFETLGKTYPQYAEASCELARARGSSRVPTPKSGSA
jgi:hypothetical protein